MFIDAKGGHWIPKTRADDCELTTWVVRIELEYFVTKVSFQSYY